MKKYLLISLMAVSVIGIVWASDDVGSGSGVVRSTPVSRWITKSIGAMTTSVTDARTSVTNQVTTTKAEIGKVLFKANALNDELFIYDSLSNSFTAADVIFHCKATTDTLFGNVTGANTPTIGSPLIFDLAPGYSAATAITTVMKRSATSTLLEGWITYDKTR